ncbi:alpha/beta hydrolase [Stappia sp. BW2]|uniref:alpha/beta hydrolase n=1 Tax=Stappia sp. BW2 TaxID=2592622 RepID=UPI001AD8DD20|nr:alpha/beta hydrolase [Stappia sp. BW2]
MTETSSGGAGEAMNKTGRPGRLLWKALLRVAVIVGIAYAMAAGYMYFNQRSFIFIPSGELSTPEEKGLSGVSVETVSMSDGTNVTVWRAEPSARGAPTVLYFQGNAANVSSRWKRFKQILDSGFGLYAPSYRGYPGSEGSPSEQALISDGLEHFDRLAGSGTPLIIHGESLGSGVAAAVAAERPQTDLVVLEAPYTALIDMATKRYPWLPVGLLMKDPMPTRDRIGRIAAPVLIVHGTEDSLIPVEHGRRLFEFANNPKQLVIVEGGGHSTLWSNGLWNTVLSAWAQRQE